MKTNTFTKNLCSSRAARAIIGTSLIFLALSNSGCESTAAVVAGTALGVGVGLPLTTQSHITVTVEAFQDSMLPMERDQAAFTLPGGASIISKMRAASDPAMHPTVENMQAVVNRLADFCGALQGQLDHLRTQQSTTATPDLIDALQRTLDSYARFRETVHIASGRIGGLTQQDLSQMVDALTDVRFSLGAVRQADSYYGSKPGDALKVIGPQPAPSFDAGGQPRNVALKATTPGALANDALTFSFSGPLSDINFGPLISEIMQEVMSKGRAIDLMLDKANEDKWRTFQVASSDAGPGDHNSVIYLENMGTPMIKTGKFDPTQFTVAFGALYRKALAAVAQVAGAPMQTTGQQSTTQPANIHLVDAQRKAADDRSARARAETLSSLKALVDAYASYDKGMSGDVASIDAAKAAADALKKTAISLQSVRTK